MQSGIMARLATPLILGLLLVGACADSAGPPAGALFRVDVLDESFHVLIVDPAVVAEAVRRMDEQHGVAIVIGALEAGDGGFNQPWSWHLVPATVQIADNAIELCDGLPSMVEADLSYWIDTVQSFCPWAGRLAERIY